MEKSPHVLRKPTVFLLFPWVFHFLGAVFALLLTIMALSSWIRPMAQPWEHHHSGDVDLTPWKWAKPMGIGLAVAVLLLYMAFADTSVL